MSTYSNGDILLIFVASSVQIRIILERREICSPESYVRGGTDLNGSPRARIFVVHHRLPYGAMGSNRLPGREDP